MTSTEYIEEHFVEMVSTGCLTVDGWDEDENIFYTLDVERCEKVIPDFYHMYMDEIDEDVMNLASQGLVELDFSDENIGMTLTDKGMKYAQDIIDSLNQT